MVPDKKQNQEEFQMLEEDFEALLNESLSEGSSLTGKVINGNIIDITNDFVLVDVGLKSEGKIPLKEFASDENGKELKVGDKVNVFVDRVEDRHGEVVLSRDKARREEAWVELQKSYDKNERVTGVIFGRVKGGFTVDLSGAVAFLPGSQVDVRPIRDASPLIGAPQPFQILKMDRARGNIVVSRRAVLEETRQEAKDELVSNIKEGQVLKGVVKNITDYGAFVDLGGVDGLLHVTDLSWKRVNHPSEILEIGQSIEVCVIRYNEETKRISLGLKQLQTDPWKEVPSKYEVGKKVKGTVTNITDYGAFVELEPGIEGLVYVTEMSWTKKNLIPSNMLSTSEDIEVMVLDVDTEKRRISLGIKQCEENPWEALEQKFPEGSEQDVTIKSVVKAGLVIELDQDIEGFVHYSNLSWNSPSDKLLEEYKEGDSLKVKVLEYDHDRDRVELGVKQLTEDPFKSAVKELKKGNIVTCTITEVQANGLVVTVGDNVKGYIKKGDLSRERSEQKVERFAVDEKVDAKITSIDKNTRQLNLSIKAREIEEEKKAMEQYGSSDSGASLGDILGAAISKAKDDKEDKKEAPQEKKTKAKSSKESDKAPEEDKKEAKGDDKQAEEGTDVEEPKKEASA